MMNRFKKLYDGLVFTSQEKHLLNFFRDHSVKMDQSGEGQILIEFSAVYSNIIGLFFFTQALKKTKFKLVSYLLRENKFSTSLFLKKYFKFYKTMGVNNFIYSYQVPSHSVEVERKLVEIKDEIKTKSDLEHLKINGVWVGDIIYDSYLMKNLQPTVDLNSEALDRELREAIAYYLYWENYLNNNKVQVIIASHTVYSHFAIITRIGVKRGIDVYQVNDYGFYKLSDSKSHAYHEFFDFKEMYQDLPENIKLKGKEWAKNRLDMRFGGAVGVDMSYSKKSAWSNSGASEYIKPSDKIKVFIAPHCFFDSPHPYGLNLFPDFYEWLTFLGEISNKTDYEWYLKTHPDFIPDNYKILEKFINKYPKFKIIPSETSHHSIIQAGINCALTVYGTIGMEYAYFGIPVINASANNIHCAFDFNLHPKTISDYGEILMNLSNINLTIDREEIYAFYFVKHYLCQQSWLWDTYEDMLTFIGGQQNLGGKKVIAYFFKVMTPERFNNALENASRFIESRKYCNQKNYKELRF